MKEQIKTEKFLTSSEAAEILDINEFRVRQLCREGKLVGRMSRNSKNVRVWLITIESVTQYKNTRKARPKFDDGRRKMNIYINENEYNKIRDLLPEVRMQIANPRKEKE